MTPVQLWHRANRDLIAKSIGELSFEGVFNPRQLEDEADTHLHWYSLDLKSQVSYRFQAWKGVWDHLRVKSDSIERWVDSANQIASDAGQFFLDAQTEVEMTDLVLGTFLEEMHSTLLADVQLLRRTQNLSSDEIADWSGNEVQTVLNGHPKLLLNKGRMGWGHQDLARYAPESASPFQLHWIAVAKDHCKFGAIQGVSNMAAALQGLDGETLDELLAQLTALHKNPDEYFFMPVHPWQWDQVVQLLYAGEIASGDIVDLGIAGDFYLPQISLRSLYNVSRPGLCDLKLPLTILNTSAVRGLPPRYTENAPAISQEISKLCSNDPLLRTLETQALKERFAISVTHPIFSQVKGFPYRYTETLGCVWRESVESQLSSGERGLIAASLSHQDFAGVSLIGVFIRRSTLTPTAWLRAYFSRVVIPLYHLQLQHGLGFVAHGQNVVVRFKDYVPQSLFLKDFHGDLRVSNERSFTGAIKGLDALPPEHLIHDLITGHFSSVLRFMSETLEESNGFYEADFYSLLRECIQAYLKEWQPAGIANSVDLLQKTFDRVLLNKVRFKIGYADLSERPRPMVGTKLENPLLTSGERE